MSEEWPIPNALEQEVFFGAIARTNLAERATYLETACRGQPDLRGWVEAEIRRQMSNTVLPTGPISPGPAPSPLPPPSSGSTFGSDAEAMLMALKPEEAGDHIGAYRLVEPLGEGGFGIVWMAEQERPVRRQVALKIIRLGMNSREVMARFSQERQALALMDHPGIAKVFDAGATPFGRPFFVMELVHGISITDYCDEARLTIRQRLEMFMQVCYAVQHAHQKGIIHRDLKPPNVLITLLDGVATPKVIDFGIAKATQQQRLTELTLVTQKEFMLGTPLYMSPEQTGISDLDVDTRSDIYSLGVLLYKLLTGRTPIDPEVLNRSSFDEMARIVRDGVLPRPTTVLRDLAREERSEVARLRQNTVSKLVQSVRGDLEWICMKALEKDRRRRYASAAAFASDIQHFLLDEPISARPPDRWYRARKMVTRNRRAFLVGAVLFTTIIVGAVTGVTETLRARGAESAALRSRAAEARQRVRAEHAVTDARLSEYVSDVAFAQQSIRDGNLGRAVQLLDKHRPQEAGGPDLRGFDWRYLWGLGRGDAHSTFPGLEGAASAIAFSPEGEMLAVGGREQIAIFEAATHRKVATIPAGAGSLGFLPDGKTLVTMMNNTVHLWRTADWREESSWPEGPGPLVLSRDGKRLAVVCADGVRLRDTATWKEVRFLPGVLSPVAFSPDGNILAGDSAGGIGLWRLDAAKEKEPRVLADSAGIFSRTGMPFFRPVQLLAFSPDGTSLIAPQNWFSERGVFLLRTWDTRTGQEGALMSNDPQRPQHRGAIASLAVSPDGALLATAGLDHTVCLWDLNRRTCIARLQGHQAEVVGSAFSPDGRTLVTCDRLGAVNAWPLHDRRKEDILSGVTRPLRFSSDGHTLAVVSENNTVAFCDATTKQELARLALEPAGARGEASIALSADLRVLAQGLETGYVKVWDTSTKEAHSLYVASGPVDLVALTPDGETLVTGSQGTILRTHNFRTGEETYLPFSASRVIISPDGRMLAAVSSRSVGLNAGTTGSGAGSLVTEVGTNNPTLKDLPSGTPTPPIRAGEGEVLEDLPANGVPLWDLATHTLRGKLTLELRHVLDAAFSPDGSVFTAAVSDNTVQLWDTQNCKLLGTCTGHKQIVSAVAFSSDGKCLASASEDGTIRLWNTATQQELLTILDFRDRMRELFFSPDDRTLLVACAGRSDGEMLRFYRAPSFEETDRSVRP